MHAKTRFANGDNAANVFASPRASIAAAERMKKGFYTIMSAQFFSSLADNALLVAAIEMLKTTAAPSWQIPALARCSRSST